VLDRRLLRLAEDFEAAAFSSGLVGPSGFDDDGEAGGGGTAAAASPASRVYRLLPPVTPLCALRDPDGRLDRVRAVLQRLAPERPWEYNSRVHSDASQLDQVTEAVRERLLHHLHKCGGGARGWHSSCRILLTLCRPAGKSLTASSRRTAPGRSSLTATSSSTRPCR